MEMKLLDRYQIIEELGQGGMAIVYKGIDTVLMREVAIKILHPHLSTKNEAKTRFYREAHAIAKLNHPNIVEIYDFSGIDTGKNFIITEYIKGKSLRKFLDNGRINIPEIAGMIVLEVSDALKHAHNIGIIHRDVKPENIMIREDGIIKLMDFGIAQIVDMQHLTITGAIVGSPAHMSPEHIEGKNLDFRADIFSLGTLFYLLSTGDYPFKGSSPHALLRNILEVNFKDPRFYNKSISDEIYGMITKMLKKNPDERYQQIDNFITDITTYLKKYGIISSKEELKKYFSNPSSYEEELKNRIINYHQKESSFLIKKRKYYESVTHLNRVLSLDEKNTIAIKSLKEIERKSRKKAIIKYFLYGCFFAVIIYIFSFNFSFFMNYIIPKKKETLIVKKTAPIIKIREGFENVIFGRRTIVTEYKILPLRKKKVILAVGENGKIPVKIYANPPAVQIFVDNILKGYGTTGEIMLNEGSHTVKLIHPDCSICVETTYKFNLSSKNPPKAPLRYSIRYKDALLFVQSNVKNAQIFVNGIFKGSTGHMINIPMTSPKEVDSIIKVGKEGYEFETITTKFSPGVFKQFQVSLREKEK